MEQFRQIGEVLGSLKALFVFKDDIPINQRQCNLLMDAFSLAFDVIAEEMRQNLRFEERLTKWDSLEGPLRELYSVFREGESYIRQSMETKDWLAKAISLSQNTDCVDFHLHNLFWCNAIVIEALENASEISGMDQEGIHRKRIMLTKKYDQEWLDQKLFHYKFGNQYLLNTSIIGRLDKVWKEDQWIRSEMISERSTTMPKQENQLSELLLDPKGKIFPSSLLVGSKNYQVRRRLGNESQYKEIQWMGENFAVRHFMGDIKPMMHEISIASSVRHFNIMHVMYAFYDEEKKECFLVTELMSKSLSGYMKEVSSSKKKFPLPLLVAVDIMLQVARGMEYLHSEEIYHGQLNPSNILVRQRISTPEGYLHAKVRGFGLLGEMSPKASTNQALIIPCIWYAPEVLSEQEQSSDSRVNKYTEKADVYSFAMVCFQLLTGKVPFEDDNLQGDKIRRNIIAGVRPLFPFSCPKYLTNLTKRCWQGDPAHRPSFASICRVLRYIKRFFVMNPDSSHSEIACPPTDYLEVDMSLSKKFNLENDQGLRVSNIPFQMFAYRVTERERTHLKILNLKERSSESESEGTSVCGDENGFGLIIQDDCIPSPVSSFLKEGPTNSLKSSSHNSSNSPKKALARKTSGKTKIHSGHQQKNGAVKPPQLTLTGRTLRTNSESRLRGIGAIVPLRRSLSGHVSDSELA